MNNIYKTSKKQFSVPDNLKKNGCTYDKAQNMFFICLNNQNMSVKRTSGVAKKNTLLLSFARLLELQVRVRADEHRWIMCIFNPSESQMKYISDFIDNDFVLRPFPVNIITL